MTIQNSGSVSTRDVSQQLNGYGAFTATVSTGDGSVQRLARKTSGIRFPNDFRGKGWGQQMTEVVSGGYNAGDSSNMKPYMMDRRVDGGKTPGLDKHKLDSSRTNLGGCYIYNNINNGTTPAELAWNGYFVVHNPIGGEVSASVNYETNYIYSPGYPVTSMHLFGFSSGYLEGSRITIASSTKSSGGSGTLYPRGNYSSTYRYICVNLSLWMSEAGRAETWMYDGYAQ